MTEDDAKQPEADAPQGVEQPPAEDRRRVNRKATTMPVDQFQRAYVPGKTYVNPKSGTKHEDH
jgi:hypothetical protein